MTKKMRWKLILIMFAIGLGLWKAYPPLDIYSEQGELLKEGKINLGLDLQGGLQVLLEADLPPEQIVDPGAMEATRAIIEQRVNSLGVSEPLIQLSGGRRIIVELPGIEDPERAIETFGETGLLEYIDAGLTFLPAGTIVKTTEDVASPAPITPTVTITPTIPDVTTTAVPLATATSETVTATITATATMTVTPSAVVTPTIPVTPTVPPTPEAPIY